MTSTVVAPTMPRVILLWDYENAPIPHETVTRPGTCASVVRRFVDRFQAWGAVQFKLVANLDRLTAMRRQDLQDSGVMVLDASTVKGRKEVADKMLITEMFSFALDHPAPAGIVIISGDVDFIRPLNHLAARGYRSAMVVPNGAQVQDRMLQAVPCYLWNDVLNLKPDLSALQLTTPSSPGRVDATVAPRIGGMYPGPSHSVPGGATPSDLVSGVGVSSPGGSRGRTTTSGTFQQQQQQPDGSRPRGRSRSQKPAKSRGRSVDPRLGAFPAATAFVAPLHECDLVRAVLDIQTGATPEPCPSLAKVTAVLRALPGRLPLTHNEVLTVAQSCASQRLLTLDGIEPTSRIRANYSSLEAYLKRTTR